MVDERIVEAAAEGHVGAFVLSGQTELVERLEAYVHVAVLKQFVVEVFLGEIGVQRKQGTVFAGGVGERNLAGGVLFTVLGNLAAGGLVVGLGGAGEPQHILHVGPVHIGLGEVGIEFDGFVVVGQGVLPALHLYEIGSAVEVRQHVAGVDVDHPVHIVQSLFEIA